MYIELITSEDEKLTTLNLDAAVGYGIIPGDVIEYTTGKFPNTVRVLSRHFKLSTLKGHEPYAIFKVKMIKGSITVKTNPAT